jgi:TctA family transporter
MPQDQYATRHAWLDATAARTASDIVLGIVLVGAAAVAFLGVGDAPLGRLGQVGPGFFPAVIGGLLALVGLVLLVRGALVGTAPPQRWSLSALAIIVAVLAAAYFATWTWGLGLALLFGPAEFASFMVFILAVAAALARVSRLRAVGMVLLGLLLAMVGTDVETGTARFTMELEQLADGIMLPIVSLGLIIVADALICLASPSLWLATYARRIVGWTGPPIPIVAAIAMRLVALLAVAAACYYAFELNRTMWDVGLLFGLGLFGTACKILGWNRPGLILAFAYGVMLEENIRRGLLLSQGDPTIFLRSPISGTLLLVAIALLAVVAMLSLRRVPPSRAAQ